ncbi:MAG: sulfatase [Naasia sp.]|nr:sulfatase [Naasia sp.]
MPDRHARVAAGADERPNVLWISTHDINPDLGAYRGVWPGAQYADTPHLDGLAAEGALYEHAFASAPVCAPSRSAILTGCHPTAIGTIHMRTKAATPPEVRLLPEYFREAGYYTTNNVFTDFQVQTPPTVFDECSTGAHWRNRPDPDQPFFAMFHSSITHESRLYLDEEDFATATADVSPERRHDPALAPLPPYHPDTEVFRTTWARYADLITQMDSWAGELLHQLDEDGLADDTIVVFWSDHGAGMPRAKRWLREAGLRVPLMLRWPGRVEPGRRPELVHLLDLAPTMLQACGIAVPDHMHGRPIRDAAGGPLAPNEHVFGARSRIDEQEDDSLTVRDQRFRYVRHAHPDRSPMQHSEYPDRFATWRELRALAFADAQAIAGGVAGRVLDAPQRSVLAAGRPAEELFDLEADPYEVDDLAGAPTFSGELDRLRGALDAWLAVQPLPWPISEAELLEAWRPGGTQQRTADPELSIGGRDATAACATPGASIGWTTDEPGPLRERSEVEIVTGAPEDDGRHWNLYTGPVRLGDRAVRFRAWRLGFEPSDEVIVLPDGTAATLRAEAAPS